MPRSLAEAERIIGPVTPKCANIISPKSLYSSLPSALHTLIATFLRDSPCMREQSSDEDVSGMSEGTSSVPVRFDVIVINGFMKGKKFVKENIEHIENAF